MQVPRLISSHYIFVDYLITGRENNYYQIFQNNVFFFCCYRNMYFQFSWSLMLYRLNVPIFYFIVFGDMTRLVTVRCSQDILCDRALSEFLAN